MLLETNSANPSRDKEIERRIGLGWSTFWKHELGGIFMIMVGANAQESVYGCVMDFVDTHFL